MPDNDDILKQATGMTRQIKNLVNLNDEDARANPPKRGIVLGDGEAVVGWAKTSGIGVRGISTDGIGVLGQSNDRGVGVSAGSKHGNAVYAVSPGWAGVFAGAVTIKKSPTPNAENINDGNLVIEEGNIHVNKGDVFVGGADCAEEFTTKEAVEPGTVMIIGDEDTLQHSFKAYDKRVAGVVSGGGSYRSGIILDRRADDHSRAPIALIGKVFCKVDASYAPIETGDLLTTSDTAGHAMKVLDSHKALGAIIGKALKPHAEGVGFIPILIGLQ